MRCSKAALAIVLFVASSFAANAQKDHLLLELRDGVAKPITYDHRCDAEAAATLLCHAVTLTITNQFDEDVRINWEACPGPEVSFDALHSGHWEPLGSPKLISCAANAPQWTVLKPGEHYDFPMLLGWSVTSVPAAAGPITLRAIWPLGDCKPENAKEKSFCDSPFFRIQTAHFQLISNILGITSPSERK
jgi:hypothetical protein